MLANEPPLPWCLSLTCHPERSEGSRKLPRVFLVRSFAALRMTTAFLFKLRHYRLYDLTPVAARTISKMNAQQNADTPGRAGENLSLWEATIELAKLNPIREDASADVCVVGAGIAGLTTAYLLGRARSEEHTSELQS